MAERSAKHVNAKFNVFHATQEMMTDAFEDAVWHWEAPMIDFNGTAKFMLSKYVRDAGYKVVLTGTSSSSPFRQTGGSA